MKRIGILGSTGSIGCSALSVIEAHMDRLEVASLAAGENSARLAEQVERFRPRVVAMATAGALAQVERGLSVQARRRLEHLAVGAEGLVTAATHPAVDLVLCASSGTAALEAVLAAIEAGKTIALANKEVLVMAGGLVTEAARRHGVLVLPVDSEHNAIHQCLHGRDAGEVRRLILTASGGPFRHLSASELEGVTPEAALRHPTWRMGPKITIDSATLMNKGLEVIEAHWLFGVPPDRIDVVIHPQSIIHSMVELTDGSVIAQLGVTDMRMPIQYAFSFPERWAAATPPLNLAALGRLEFAEPDRERFPCLSLAYRALSDSGALPVVLNAANEVAVASFLDGRLSFPGIARLIEHTLDAGAGAALPRVDAVEEVRAVDRWARDWAAQTVESGKLAVKS